MGKTTCDRCGIELPATARFCRACGSPAGSTGTGWWVVGIVLWIAAGALSAVSAAEGWAGMGAASGFLFSVPFLVIIIVAGTNNSG